MTKDEIAKVIEYADRIPDPTMSNYRQVLASYKSVLRKVLVALRDLADED